MLSISQSVSILFLFSVLSIFDGFSSKSFAFYEHICIRVAFCEEWFRIAGGKFCQITSGVRALDWC